MVLHPTRLPRLPLIQERRRRRLYALRHRQRPRRSGTWKRAGIRFSVQHLLAEPGDISGGAPIAPKSQRASPTTPTLPPRPVERSRRSVEVLECDLSGNPIVRDDAAFSLEASDPLCIRTIKFEPNADATAILLDEDGA